MSDRPHESLAIGANVANSKPGPRRFTLLDGMILTAAAGVWFAYARVLWRIANPPNRNPRRFTDPVVAREVWLSMGMIVSSALLVALLCLTLAYLLMRLRQPRPSLKALVWQPGMMACLALFGVTAMIAVIETLFHVTENSRAPKLMVLLYPIGILGAWIFASARGRLRPEPSWIDRLGRGLGIGFALMGVSTFVLAQIGSR